MDAVIAFALLMVLAVAVFIADRSVAGRWTWYSKPKRAVAGPFPRQLQGESQWQRVTAVVDRSVVRTSQLVLQQAAAERQLEAAEYALHCLLQDLGGVMKTTVGSPLQAKSMPASMSHIEHQALAA